MYPVDSESTLSRIARQNFGVELSIDPNDGDKKLPAPKPSGRGFVSRRGNTKLLDCYNLEVAPMNIFENQIIPVGIHNLSKSFCPNLATIRVLALGTKFIPKWDTTKTGNTFKRFNEFKNQMNAKVYFFVESKPGVFEKNKNKCLKNNFVPPTEYMAVNNFCWNVRDGINFLFETRK